MKLSVVVLTMGNRPEELARAVRSALEQEHVDIEVVLVGNGVDPVGDRAGAAPFDDERVRTVTLPKNLGIPGGRNRGVEASSGDVILFLDDDGWYRSTRLGTYLRDRFSAEPDLGVVSFRVRDPEGGRGERRHVPRLRAGDPERSSAATTFLGGASAIRRAAFDAGGGLPRTSSTPTRRPTSPGRSSTPGTGSSTTPRRSCSTRRSCRRGTTCSTATTPATASGWPAATSRGRSP